MSYGGGTKESDEAYRRPHMPNPHEIDAPTAYAVASQLLARVPISCRKTPESTRGGDYRQR